MKAYCDGGTLGNGTKDAKSYGSYKIDEQDVIRLKFGSLTNNESEYKTLIVLLGDLKNQNLKNIEIFTDSQLLINQISGNWKINKNSLFGYAAEARILLQQCESKLTWISRDNIFKVLGH